MKCTDATKFHRKSGVAQWRDLQFPHPTPQISIKAEATHWVYHDRQPSSREADCET
jgi:hypothetical protein